MGKIRDDFIAAPERLQLKFCINYIIDEGEKNKSNRKIIEGLEKTGAEAEMIRTAFDAVADELSSESERAKNVVTGLTVEWERPYTPAQLRKAANKLGYMGFEEDVIYEIMEGLTEYY